MRVILLAILLAALQNCFCAVLLVKIIQPYDRVKKTKRGTIAGAWRRVPWIPTDNEPFEDLTKHFDYYFYSEDEIPGVDHLNFL